MTITTKRAVASVVLFTIALVLGSFAARSVFASHPGFFASSARTDELITDGFGIAASMIAIMAAFVAYPLRAHIWARAYLTLVILFALAYAFEFGLGFLWFAADKFRPFGQHH